MYYCIYWKMYNILLGIKMINNKNERPVDTIGIFQNHSIAFKFYKELRCDLLNGF